MPQQEAVLVSNEADDFIIIIVMYLVDAHLKVNSVLVIT